MRKIAGLLTLWLILGTTAFALAQVGGGAGSVGGGVGGAGAGLGAGLGSAGSISITIPPITVTGSGISLDR
jgi:hypothetical protein